MENEQLTEEQLYYRDKYLKYKLKYLALKEQQGGEGAKKFFSNLASQAANLASKASQKVGKIGRNIVENYNFDLSQINDYLKTYTKEEDIEKLNTLNKYDIFNKIRSKLTYRNKERAIDEVISKELKDEENIEQLRTYAKKSIDNFYEHKAKINNFNPETTKQDIESNCLCHTIIKKNILTKIKDELKKNIIIDDAIKAVINNDKDLNNDKEGAKTYLTSVIKI
jgi:hypothetical protein